MFASTVYEKTFMVNIIVDPYIYIIMYVYKYFLRAYVKYIIFIKIREITLYYVLLGIIILNKTWFTHSMSYAYSGTF